MGNHRVIYTIDDDLRRVVVEFAGPRDKAYEKPR
jgi:mRNA-degrading endonuclease RelE of RelBE toxin-antitoxin system